MLSNILTYFSAPSGHSSPPPPYPPPSPTSATLDPLPPYISPAKHKLVATLSYPPKPPTEGAAKGKQLRLQLLAPTQSPKAGHGIVLHVGSGEPGRLDGAVRIEGGEVGTIGRVRVELTGYTINPFYGELIPQYQTSQMLLSGDRRATEVDAEGGNQRKALFLPFALSIPAEAPPSFAWVEEGAGLMAGVEWRVRMRARLGRGRRAQEIEIEQPVTLERRSRAAVGLPSEVGKVREGWEVRLGTGEYASIALPSPLVYPVSTPIPLSLNLPASSSHPPPKVTILQRLIFTSCVPGSSLCGYPSSGWTRPVPGAWDAASGTFCLRTKAGAVGGWEGWGMRVDYLMRVEFGMGREKVGWEREIGIVTDRPRVVGENVGGLEALSYMDLVGEDAAPAYSR